MDARIKDLWITALTSGEYEQTTGKLYDDATGGYCCLGVLCKLAEAEGIGKFDNDLFYVEDDANLCPQQIASASLPNAVCAWADLSERGHYQRGERALDIDNDRGKTFLQIAAIIKANF